MKTTMKISPSRLEALIGLLATMMIATALFLVVLNEPARLETAQQSQLESDLDSAATLYAENCSVCHGIAGEGIGATPALDNSALRSSDPQVLQKVIARGLYDTAMPAWSLEDGGPLGDYAINTLVELIQFGDWQQVSERVVDLGLAPRIPFTAEPDPTILQQIASLPDGDLLVNGIQLYAKQCVACHGADGLGSTLAPALNDPAVREKPLEEIERIILQGVPGTLMASWQKTLTSDDLSALVTLITRWGEVPVGAIPAPDRPVPVTEASLALGEQLFATNCSRCHGPEGQGSQRAPALNVKGFLSETGDMAIQQIITLGVPNTSMPAWGDRMTEAEIQAVVGFIRSWEPTAPEVAQPTRIRGPWWQSNTNAAGNLPSGGTSGHGPGQGANATAGAQGRSSPDNLLASLDWRILALVLALLLLAGSLMAAGIRGMRKLAR